MNLLDFSSECTSWLEGELGVVFINLAKGKLLVLKKHSACQACYVG